MAADPRMVAAVIAAIDARRGHGATPPLIVGLCGSQGSGKSTLAGAVAAALDAAGIATAVVSLDDLYKTHADRLAMAQAVHPLFATRGVPGTHDVALGKAVVGALRRGDATALPRFDKASDDRAAAAAWPIAPAATQVLILEGWFVGARPQADAALAAPVNALEREEDADGRWRHHANAALAEYQPLFARVDLLVLLAAPSFAVVRGWRGEQEAELRRRTGQGMSAAALDRFVAHYERLTRHVLATMPAYADLVFRLDERRRLIAG